MSKLFVRISVLSIISFAGLYLIASQGSTETTISSKTQSAPKAEPIKWVEDRVASMTLEEKIGQFFMVAAYSGKPESHRLHLDSLISKYHIGGLIFFQGDRDN